MASTIGVTADGCGWDGASAGLGWVHADVSVASLPPQAGEQAEVRPCAVGTRRTGPRLTPLPPAPHGFGARRGPWCAATSALAKASDVPSCMRTTPCQTSTECLVVPAMWLCVFLLGCGQF